jgi:hypothetical protein
MPLLDATNPTAGVDTGQAVNSAIQVGMANQGNRGNGGAVNQANQLAQSQLGLQASSQNFQQKMAVDQALQQKKNDAFQQTIAQQQLAMQQQQEERAQSLGVQQSVFQQMSQQSGERWRTFQEDEKDIEERYQQAVSSGDLEETQRLEASLKDIRAKRTEYTSLMNKQALFQAALSGGGAKVLAKYKDMMTPLVTQQQQAAEKYNAKIKQAFSSLGGPMDPSRKMNTSTLTPETLAKMKAAGMDEAQIRNLEYISKNNVADPTLENPVLRVLESVAGSLGVSTMTTEEASRYMNIVFRNGKDAETAKKMLNTAGVSDDDLYSIHQALSANLTEQLSIVNGANTSGSYTPELAMSLAAQHRDLSKTDLSKLRRTDFARMDKDLYEVGKAIRDNMGSLMTHGLMDNRQGIRENIEWIIKDYEKRTGTDIPQAVEEEFIRSTSNEVDEQVHPLVKQRGLKYEDFYNSFGEGFRPKDFQKELDALNTQEEGLKAESGVARLNKRTRLAEGARSERRSKFQQNRALDLQDLAAMQEFLPKRPKR